MSKNNQAAALKNRCADLLAAMAKERGVSVESIHPFTVLMTIALSADTVSVQNRIEASRRALGFVAPVLSSQDVTSGGEQLQPGTKVTHLHLVQQLTHADPNARLEMLRLLSAPELLPEEEPAE